ncbi:TetR/AcrR family transcriptional regulator [Actinoplanes bogorensis]|uniref:TetR/AcrR family transcriptional regulator n=1 Tax=Paractinoplanes bogorensis TaxID=1610840 RepID=A0ABS5YGV9_9ACTN|nr:TetR/AcrR family transcriptional regulator [Actinoplanes bogorensis]MBU2662581.1 TetR/AcrR family transcriptional regulator [Actinoplanes bogorensis]
MRGERVPGMSGERLPGSSGERVPGSSGSVEVAESGRREQVLGAALVTFARFGYRKTSMEDVARAANISRPGLYFLFESKPSLFRAAVVQALDEDVAAAEQALADTGRPLRDRLIEAFDRWTGRYIGPMAREVAVLMETNPELLGTVMGDYPRRFRELVTDAIAAATPRPGTGTSTPAADSPKSAAATPTPAAATSTPAAATPAARTSDRAADVARTLLSTSVGIKHEVATRDEFVARMTVAVDLFLAALRAPAIN